MRGTGIQSAPKVPRWLALLLAVLGICLGVSVLWQGSPTVLDGTSERDSSVNTDPKDEATLAAAHEESLSAATSTRLDTWGGGYALAEKNFMAGKNELLARYGPESPQLASYVLEWSHACAQDLSRAEADAGGSSQAGAIMREFCKGVAPISDVESVNIYKQSVRTEFSMKLSQIERTQGVDSALDFAESYIKQAQDPYSVRAGLDYMVRAEVLSPPPSERSVGSERRLREIYEMARDSYICDLYGGCSATSPVSARFCLEVKCPHVTGYRQQVGNQLSRSDLSAFNWYVNAIRTLRN